MKREGSREPGLDEEKASQQRPPSMFLHPCSSSSSGSEILGEVIGIVIRLPVLVVAAAAASHWGV